MAVMVMEPSTVVMMMEASAPVMMMMTSAVWHCCKSACAVEYGVYQFYLYTRFTGR